MVMLAYKMWCFLER